MTTWKAFAIGVALIVLGQSFAARAQTPVVTPPVSLVQVPAQYTPQAARARIQGEVVLRVTITAEGTVTDPVVYQSLDRVTGLDDSAIAAVRQWKYKPATRNGLPIAIRATVHVRFVLRAEDGQALPPASDPPPGAAQAPAPAASAWPAAFPDHASAVDTAAWTPRDVALGDLSMSFRAPATWAVPSAGAGGANRPATGAISPSGLDAFMVMPPAPAPAALQLPMSDVNLQEFGARTRLAPSPQGPVISVGQVQLNGRWWQWVETAQTSSDFTYLPLELRGPFALLRITATHTWTFLTREGDEASAIAFYELFTGDVKPSDLRRSTATFRAVLESLAIRGK